MKRHRKIQDLSLILIGALCLNFWACGAATNPAGDLDTPGTEVDTADLTRTQDDGLGDLPGDVENLPSVVDLGYAPALNLALVTVGVDELGFTHFLGEAGAADVSAGVDEVVFHHHDSGQEIIITPKEDGSFSALVAGGIKAGDTLAAWTNGPNYEEGGLTSENAKKVLVGIYFVEIDSENYCWDPLQRKSVPCDDSDDSDEPASDVEKFPDQFDNDVSDVSDLVH